MVCDYLRSCYSTTARLHDPQLGRTSTIVWYWAAPGAKVLPHRSGVVSLNWSSGDESAPARIGEVPGARRTWRDGSMPHRPAGQEFHGLAEYYTVGERRQGPFQRTRDGILVECLGPKIVTGCCPNHPIPRGVFGHVTGKTGIHTALPDVLDLIWDGPTLRWQDRGAGMRARLWDFGDQRICDWWITLRCASAGEPTPGWRMELFSTDGAAPGFFSHGAVSANAGASCDPLALVFNLSSTVTTETGTVVVGSSTVTVATTRPVV